MTAVRERVFHNATEKLLMMCLCDYINGDDVAIAGAGRTLAPDVGVDPRTIRRTLARLESVGVVERVRYQYTEDNGGRAPDAIRFCWDGFQQLELVRHEVDKMSPKPPGAERRPATVKMSSKGGGQNAPKEGGLSGSSAPPSSFRTPLVNTLPPSPSRKLASVTPVTAQAPDVERLCNLLADLIEANGCRRPNVTQSWLADMEKLLRIDGYPPEKVERAIRWAQGDAFWRANILSPHKLRAQYRSLQLRHRAEREAASGARGAPTPPSQGQLTAEAWAAHEAQVAEEARAWSASS